MLSDPISSSAGAIGLVALAALAWAVADGDVRLLPLGAVVAAWVLQQHLSIVVPGAALVLWALAALVVRAVARRRADADPPDQERWRPWVLGALLASAVLWIPVAIDQVTGDPGNLTAIVRYAQGSETEALGAVAGLRQVVRAVGLPPALLREDLSGRDVFGGPVGGAELVVSLLSVLGLVAVSIGAWNRRRNLSLLALTTLVLAGAGAWNGSQIPRSVEAFRISFYRWTFVVAWLAWLALGWAGALVVRSLAARRAGRPVPVGIGWWAPVAACLALAVPTVAALTTTGANDVRRDQDGFAALDELGDAAVEATEGADGVTLVLRGRSGILSSGTALGLRLVAEGRDLTVPDQEPRFWGDHRVLGPDEPPGEVVLLLTTGRGAVPPGPGEVLASVDLNEQLREDLAPLVATARGAPVVVSDEADEILARSFEAPQHEAIAELMATISTEPERVLSDELLLSMVMDGYFASPSFDPDQLAAVARDLPAAVVNDDDVFELRRVRRADLAELVPSRREP